MYADLVYRCLYLFGQQTLPALARALDLSARQAGTLARDMGAGRLLLTHVVPGVDHEAQRRDAAAAFGGPVDVATTGATVAV